MNVLIVCHAGKGMGLGHLVRCIPVARALQKELDANIYFLIQGDSVIYPDIEDYDHIFLDNKDDLSIAIRNKVHDNDIDLVIFDLYKQKIPTNLSPLLDFLHKNNLKLVSIDGLVDYHDKLDLIFIPSFYFPSKKYITEDTKILFGWDCYLLNTHLKPNRWKTGNRVLVLTGGSDEANLGKTLPELLNNELPGSTELNWVTGPYAEEPHIPTNPRIRFLNHQNLPGLDEIMQNSNFALTVYGVSFFELLYYGVPTVVFSPYGEKDNDELKLIERERIALVAFNQMDAVSKLKMLMQDESLAVNISERAKQIITGAGEQKLAKAISKLVA